MVRGVVTALGWFNPQIKAFLPRTVRDALRHIGFEKGNVASLCARLRPIAPSVQVVRAVLAEFEGSGVEARLTE